MQNPRAAVRGFACEGQLGPGTVEFCAPFDELRDVLWTFFDQQGHGFGPAQAVARVDGVLLVQPDFVFIGERHGNAALRPGGGRIAQVRFGEHQHVSRGAQFNCRAQSRDSAAHDSIVDMMDSVGSRHGDENRRSNRPHMVARRKWADNRGGCGVRQSWSVCYIEASSR